MIAEADCKPVIRKSPYEIASCARCGSKVEKGAEVMLWDSGPRLGKFRRWVHVECEPMVVASPAAAAAPAEINPEQLRDLVAQEITEFLTKVDLSGIDGQIATQVAAQIDVKLAEFKPQALNLEEVHKTLADTCQKLGNATADACASTLEHVGKLIEEGIPHVIEVKKWDGTSQKLEGHQHPAFEKVLKLAAARFNIFLPGPAGCGKSHLAKQVAEALGLAFGFISCSAGMSEGQLLGRLIPTGEGGKFEYSRSEFVKCYEEGGVFLIDELDAADSNVLLVLNAALANGHMAVPNRPEKPVATRHENFVCVAAANTYGRGADRQYVGRSQLDESTLDRFRVGTVPMDYDRKLEARLCRDSELRERLWSIRDKAQANRLNRIVSTRALIDCYKATLAGVFTRDEAIEQVLQGWSRDERSKVC